jgi:uncharacterized membrane protein YqjE
MYNNHLSIHKLILIENIAKINDLEFKIFACFYYLKNPFKLEKIIKTKVGDNKKFSDIFRVKNIINALIGFIETRIELYKIQFKEEVAKALTVLILVIVFLLIGLLFLIFLSHFISQLLNNWLDSDFYGYLIITVFYLVLAIIVYARRKAIKHSFADMMMEEEESEKDKGHE